MPMKSSKFKSFSGNFKKRCVNLEFQRVPSGMIEIAYYFHRLLVDGEFLHK